MGNMSSENQNSERVNPSSEGGGEARSPIINRRDFLRVASIALFAAQAACTPEAQPIIDSLTPDSPEATQAITYPDIVLSSQEVLDDFRVKCGPSCGGMNEKSLFGWSLGENNFAFFIDRNGDQAARMQFEDQWIPIYGSTVDNTVIWLVPTSGVTPVAPGADVGTTQTEIVLSYDISPILTGEDVLVQYYNPLDPVSKTNPATFLISKNSPAYGGVKNAAPLRFETPTPEVNQYKVVSIEKALSYKISADELLNGDYQKWLDTLSKPFDPSQIRDIDPIDYGGEILYNTRTIPNFEGENEGKEPFRRFVTAAYTEYKDQKYLVLPIEYYDRNNPIKNSWVVTVIPIGKYSTEQNIQEIVEWFRIMNITPIATANHYVGQDTQYALVTETFSRYPDMAERFDRFTHGEAEPSDEVIDKTALSAPGIILLTHVSGPLSTFTK
jgi:hypothetical protein